MLKRQSQKKYGVGVLEALLNLMDHVIKFFKMQCSSGIFPHMLALFGDDDLLKM